MAAGVVGQHAHVGRDGDVLDVAEQVCVQVQLDTRGVEGIDNTHVVVGEAADGVAAVGAEQVETVLRGEDVVLVDIHHGVFGQAPHALAHMTVGAVGRVYALRTDGESAMIVARSRPDVAVKVERGVERQVNLAGNGVVAHGVFHLATDEAEQRPGDAAGKSAPVLDGVEIAADALGAAVLHQIAVGGRT